MRHRDILTQKICNMESQNMPFEAWQLVQAKEIIKWIKENCNFSINSLNTLELVEDILFDAAYNKLGLKPIGKCTIKELQDELKRRGGA